MLQRPVSTYRVEILELVGNYLEFQNYEKVEFLYIGVIKDIQNQVYTGLWGEHQN